MATYKTFRTYLLTVSLIAALIFLFGPNPFECLIALSFLPFISYLLLKEGYPQILFFIMLFQWLQVTAKLFYASIFNLRFEDIILNPDTALDTFYISIIGLYVITGGIYLMIKDLDKKNKKAPQQAEKINYSTKKIVKFYLLYSVILYFTSAYIWYFQSISQILLIFLNLKWGILFLMFYLMFKNKQYNVPIIIFVVFEIILSLSGFFSQFKTYILFILFAYIGANYQTLNFKKLSYGFVGLILLINMGILWSAVKKDYRNYITQGQAVQTSLVGTGESLAYLFKLVEDLDLKVYKEASSILVERISYIDFFSVVRGRVPYVIPYENGKLTLGLIDHLVMPRFIFKDKPALDDSRDTQIYTGLTVSGFLQGTSIGMGYFSYLYIDFGPFFMMPFLFLWGVIIGLVYKTIIIKSNSTLWSFILTAPLFLAIGGFETSLYKAVGGLLIYFITVLVFIKYLQKIFNKILQHK